MKKKSILVALLCALSAGAFAQLSPITAKNKGTMYLMLGYNRSWFSKSDIYIKGTYPDSPLVPAEARGQKYDFTLLGATAEDRPEIPDIGEWDVNTPQFYFKLGYIFHGENINGIELGFDHLKYVMSPDQVMRVQGQVYDSASKAIVDIDKDMRVSSKFVAFEHANGANYIMLSFVRGMDLLRTRSEMHRIVCLVKPGAGIVLPKSNVSVHGVRNENEYHVAGYVGGIEVAFRYTLAEQFFIETAGKGCYADFSNVLITGGNSARHTFTSFEWLVGIGYQFPL
jgi:hypothetical protein